MAIAPYSFVCCVRICAFVNHVLAFTNGYNLRLKRNEFHNLLFVIMTYIHSHFGTHTFILYYFEAHVILLLLK